MRKVSTKPFSATINIGLEYGYEKQPIDPKDIISHIQKYQDSLIKNQGIYLSCSVANCDIVLSGQVEPHLKIGFINYPKFQIEHDVMKREIEKLTKSLMKKFRQNRIVIEFNDETIMFEQAVIIDNRIKQPNN
jgi:hypothetical protein